MCEDHVGLQRNQFFREYLCMRTGRRKAVVNTDITVFRPSTLLEPLPECREAGPYSGSSSAKAVSTPIRRIPSGCCARAVSGHAAARAAERDQQLPPSDGDCHTPLPCEVR